MARRTVAPSRLGHDDRSRVLEMKKLCIATTAILLAMPAFVTAQIYFGEEHERGEHHDRGRGHHFGWVPFHHHEYDREPHHHHHWDDEDEDRE